jgi:hypothetical protein
MIMTLVQKEIKAVYLWETKVRPATPAVEEKIIFKMKADSSWNLMVPVAWVDTGGSVWVSYDWQYSVDGWTAARAYWTSRSWGYFYAATWLVANSVHTITLTPTTEAYWWARAFNFYQTWVAYLLQEILYDSSYMWYWISETNTWWCFRYMQYVGCTALTTAPEEYLPDTVTTIWDNFRREQFRGCTGLTTLPDEVMPNSVTSIGAYFRLREHFSSTSLTKSAVEAMSSSVTTIWTNFRSQQYQSCSVLSEIPWWIDLSVWWANYRYQQYYQSTASKTVKVLSNVWYASADALTLQYWPVTQVQVPSAYLNNFKSTSNNPWVNISDDKFVWY